MCIHPKALPPSAPLFDAAGDFTPDAVQMLKVLARKYSRGTYHHDAADLMQDAALILLRSRGRYDPTRGSLGNWVALAVRRARFVRERAHRLRTVSLSVDVFDAPGREPAPSRGLEVEEAKAAVRRAWEALPPGRARDALRDRYGLDGTEPVTQRSTARRLGVTPQCVQHVEGRGLRALAEMPSLRSYAPSEN